MADTTRRSGLFATVAHRKRSGEVITASFDEDNLGAIFENVALLLQEWDPSRDDTTVIRVMSSES